MQFYCSLKSTIPLIIKRPAYAAYQHTHAIPQILLNSRKQCEIKEVSITSPTDRNGGGGEGVRTLTVIAVFQSIYGQVCWLFYLLQVNKNTAECTAFFLCVCV